MERPVVELSLLETGSFTFDAKLDEHRSRPLVVPMLERTDAVIVVVGYANDPTPSQLLDVVRNLLTGTRDNLLAASLDLQRYCSDMNQFCAPQDEFHVDHPHDLWNHVQIGKDIYIQRGRGRDRSVYASIECECDWEPEHGLQIVLRNGVVVSKLGPYDGRLSNADALGDPARESMVYRPIR